MNRIQTVSGKSFECDYVVGIDTPKRLYVRVLNADLTDVVQTFSDSFECAVLTFEGQKYIGYTKWLGIIPEGNALRINLTIGEE